jgi:hypothetical protein
MYVSLYNAEELYMYVSLYNSVIHVYTEIHTCITLLYRDTYMYNTIIQRYIHV